MVVVAGGGGDAAGNLLMSSLAVRVHAVRSIKLARLPFHRRRGAALAHCSLRGAEFTAVGTHLSTDERERGLQMRRLLSELPEVGPSLVFAGDINEESTGEAWSALLARLTDVGESAGDAHTPTFSCGAPSRRIDGVFVDPRTVVREYRVLDSADVRCASDHFPVYAELELPT
jgi:endonuclease/exonuclease/phosphatase family metal-dependent hydrolase